MADSPASDDSAVTAVNVGRQERDDERYAQLVQSRREAITEHHKLLVRTMIKIMGYSDQWHATKDHQKRKVIGTTLEEEAVVPYVLGVTELAKTHNGRFNVDSRLGNYLTSCTKSLDIIIKGSGSDIEPADDTKIQQVLKETRKKFRECIRDQNWKGYGVSPNFLTRALGDDRSKEAKEEGRQLIFEKYKQELIDDHETQVNLLNGFFGNGIEDFDQDFALRLKLLACSYQDNVDHCNNWRDALTMNFVEMFGNTNFFFLGPLDYLPKSGKERLEMLGFKDPGLPEPEMRQIWEKAMRKLAEERERLKSRQYRQVPLNVVDG
ncbi:hypothetical protein PISL3812_04358 [Talaromyces islandicus]|uniref:Uncharacterized protein n=1 Tax=Talaromyces islandicus TaxID=28573 RepID=A0A0U1LXE5_TALIS|nr:hypothetical protein PISL3812_04358 [Talaromyces islandicus]